MSNFIASIVAVPNIVLSQRVSLKANVSASDATSVGNYYVAFLVDKQNADGTWTNVVDTMLSGMQALSQAPKTFIGPVYTPPSFGNYRARISVRNGSYAWQSVTGAAEEWSVSDIPVINGFKYYVPIAPPPDEVGIVPLIKQFDGSYLPNVGNWQIIDGMSVIDDQVLDKTKWHRKFWNFYTPHDTYLNDELQRYIDDGVTYDGALKFTATPRAGTTGHAPSSGGIQYPLFDSGMVRSIATAKYFFSHLQIVMPKERGIWPAWWIIPGDGQIDPNPEMDMLEFVYNGANETANMIHCNCSANKALLWNDASYNTQYGYLKPNPQFYDADYWVNRIIDICILWSEDSTMTLYHDGNPTAKWYFPWFYRGGSAVPATMMLNLAIGGAWPTANWTTPVPTAPVTTVINFLKTYIKTAGKYGPNSPA